MCVCVCVRACVRACVRVCGCVDVRVRACVRYTCLIPSSRGTGGDPDPRRWGGGGGGVVVVGGGIHCHHLNDSRTNNGSDVSHLTVSVIVDEQTHNQCS